MSKNRYHRQYIHRPTLQARPTTTSKFYYTIQLDPTTMQVQQNMKVKQQKIKYNITSTKSITMQYA